MEEEITGKGRGDAESSEGEAIASEGSTKSPRKQGRPKGSPNKKPRLIAELEVRELSEVDSGDDDDDDENPNISSRGRRRVMRDLSNGISRSPQRRRRRGRPAKVQKTPTEQVTDGSQMPKRGRGRPKGGSQMPKRGRGRPKGSCNKPSASRGRPRKYPLPSPEELKKPKVWKPLGRPRKYPRVDPPEGDAPAAPRSRGRPRKAESRSGRGAHFRKSLPATSDGSPNKRSHASGTVKSGDSTPRKRGRPKLSV